MRRAVLTALLLLGWAAAASAQQTYAIEAGIGPGPWHARLFSGGFDSRTRQELADGGLDVDLEGAFYPALQLSFAWGLYRRWEQVFTLGVSWCQHKLIQYDSFGVDPAGKARYDLNTGSPGGWRASSPSATLVWQARFKYNPANSIQFYSAVGVGVVTDLSDITPVPSLTPIGVRYTGRRLYGFFEVPLVSPIALFANGGVGWRF